MYCSEENKGSGIKANAANSDLLSFLPEIHLLVNGTSTNNTTI
jgi:hypothetical protein